MHFDNYEKVKSTSLENPSSPFLVTLGTDTSRWYTFAPSDDGTHLIALDKVFVVDGDKVLDSEFGNTVRVTTVASWIFNVRNSLGKVTVGFKLGQFTVPVVTDNGGDAARAGLDQWENDDSPYPMSQKLTQVKKESGWQDSLLKAAVVASISGGALHLALAVVAVLVAHNPAGALALLSIALAWVRERLKFKNLRTQLTAVTPRFVSGSASIPMTHNSLQGEHVTSRSPQRSITGLASKFLTPL
ncbi:hypothetical protein SeLEV6574_g00959 [Synchytrium endobioticum]|uniref:Uncharacterized protein n=1 Tax=Synchytrium endobioticum TaxID=286115 RepID=A0A507DHE8_9FUNG|nr:hypothetical protein SeLEV6574_g00959 [Synchytrium endobioticum]